VARRLLIDTDVLIEYLRDRSEAVEYLDEGLASDLYMSVISVAELFACVRGDEEEKFLKQLLLAFFVLPVTERTARLGGLYPGDYWGSHGTGLADALIAATSEELGRGSRNVQPAPLPHNRPYDGAVSRD
jgi:predicted nucleic acid-binding protein